MAQKVPAQTDDTQLIAQQLEQALRRLAVQNGPTLILPVNQLVRASRSYRQPVTREDSHHKDIVQLETLSHVSVVRSKDSGLCIRMVFIDQLYATCEKWAEEVRQWAETSAATPVSKKIADFPSVFFQRVSHKVEIREGDIVMA